MPYDDDDPCSPKSVQSSASRSSTLTIGPASGGFGKIVLFTVNVLAGLLFSQLLPAWLPEKAYKVWYEVARITTMWCLSYVMIQVGYEFIIDKKNLRQYAGDYAIAMTAASFPWVFVAVWFKYFIPNPLEWDKALLAARFAAPTSAGVLFCMLEAAGLKETWLFKKARILAIFDDLDTILLMIPLKAIIIGLKWELFLVLAVLVGLVVVAYVFLHAVPIFKTWKWTMLYAALITIVTELIYYVTKEHIEMESVHLEVLMPAFVVGAIARAEDPVEHDPHDPWDIATKAIGGNTNHSEEREERVNTIVSAIFMVFVGLSMPSLFKQDEDGEGSSLKIHDYVFHVFVVSVLMIVGKMFPVLCYREEADLRTRFALALGMCPRGEVGAGVIVISLALDVTGDSVPIAIISLALNISMSGGFIFAVTKLVAKRKADGTVKWRLQRRRTHLLTRKHKSMKRLSRASRPVVTVRAPEIVEDVPEPASPIEILQSPIEIPEPASPVEILAESKKEGPSVQENSDHSTAIDSSPVEVEQIPGYISDISE